MPRRVLSYLEGPSLGDVRNQVVARPKEGIPTLRESVEGLPMILDAARVVEGRRAVTGTAIPDERRDEGRWAHAGTLGLRFADSGVEREFLADSDAKMLMPARYSVALAGILFCVFGLIDGFALPGWRPFLLALRFGVAGPLALAVVALSFSRHADRYHAPALVTFWHVTFGSLVLFAMGTHPALRMLWFALLMTSLMPHNLTLGLRFAASARLTTTAYLAYGLGSLALGFQPREAVARDMWILSAPALFGVLLAYSGERSARRDFVQRRVIDERTEQLRAALREVEAAHQEAEEASRVDPLTALFNRRHFFSEAGAPAGGRSPRSVIILDIDHFKAVNDVHGHAVGDKVIQAVAARIRENVRPCDVPCRYGGEEFAILMPGADLREAAVVGERLRAGVAAHPIATARGPISISVSVGIAAAHEGLSPIDLLVDRADQALYQAKHGGRNNVRLWSA